MTYLKEIKPVACMIVNDASSGVNKLKSSLNDAARGVVYERHMFIVQVTDGL